MNGHEHYREAERLTEAYVEAVKKIEAAQPFTSPAAFEDANLAVKLATGLLEKASVHATLALAAATAMVSADIAADGETGRQWRELIVAKRPQPIEVPS